MRNGGSTWAIALLVPVVQPPRYWANDRARALRGVMAFRSFSCLPVPWQQRIQFVPLGPSRYDALEHIGEPGQRSDIVQLRRLDQGGDDCPMPAANARAGAIVPGF